MPDTISHHRKPKYKCPDCPNKYTSEVIMLKHVERMHKASIPEDTTVRQYCFNRRNNKTFSLCTMCKVNKTKWNEQTGKYNRLCEDPACRKKAGEIADANLKKKTGKTRKERMSDPDVQREMLKNRANAGSYTFRDTKSVIDYMCSYELDFLEFYDKEFEGDPVDIIECPVVFEYFFEKEKHFYIPDFYILSLNLVIEIKDGGDDPNNHPKIQTVDKAKEKFKDEAVIQSGEYNFIKITNKEYENFINTVNILKERNCSTEKFEPLIVIPA